MAVNSPAAVGVWGSVGSSFVPAPGGGAHRPFQTHNNLCVGVPLSGTSYRGQCPNVLGKSTPLPPALQSSAHCCGDEGGGGVSIHCLGWHRWFLASSPHCHHTGPGTAESGVLGTGGGAAPQACCLGPRSGPSHRASWFQRSPTEPPLLVSCEGSSGASAQGWPLCSWPGPLLGLLASLLRPSGGRSWFLRSTLVWKQAFFLEEGLGRPCGWFRSPFICLPRHEGVLSIFVI